jgi:hypothetical protein
MQSNAVVVTAPDLYFADHPSILLIGCDEYLQDVVDNIRRLSTAITVYSVTNESTLDWVSTAYFQSEISILNCAYNDFLLGFFIDKENVYYYNNKQSYKRFNLNEVVDPIDPLIKWMAKWHTENQEKNAAYM